MRELSMDVCEDVGGGGALGTAVGMVLGGIVTAVAVMAIAGATGGLGAAPAIGVIGAAVAVGGKIGSAFEDSF